MNETYDLNEIEEKFETNGYQELYLESLKTIAELKSQIESNQSSKGSLRKTQVLELLRQSPITIYDISMKLGISNKNVSSILCYLKNDEYRIATNSKKEKFLEDYDYEQ